MRIRVAIVPLLLAGILACQREVPEKREISAAIPAPPAAWFDESTNLTSITTGAIVYDRTGETDLGRSAIALIDSDESTFWATPSNDFQQSIVLELPARARIRSISIGDKEARPETRFPTLSFDVSDDGANFRPLVTLSRKQPDAELKGTFEPVDGRFLRIRTPNAPFGPSEFAMFNEVRTSGEYLEPRKVPDISGRWQINNHTASFTQRGTTFSGVVDMQPPMQIEGTWDDGCARYLWMRGKQFGLGVLSANRESSKLNALWWFEESIPLFFAEAWFGDRIGTAPAAVPPSDLWVQFLRRFRRTGFYAITFSHDGALAPDSRDGVAALARLLQQSPKVRLEIQIREIRQADPGVNLALAKKEADALSAALRASGTDLSRVSVEATSDGPHNLDMTSNIQRLIYSRVEVELAGEQR